MSKKHKKKLLLISGSVFTVFLVLIFFGLFDFEPLVTEIYNVTNFNDASLLSLTCSIESGKEVCRQNNPISRPPIDYKRLAPTIIGGIVSIDYKIDYFDNTSSSGNIRQKFPIVFTKLSIFNSPSNLLMNVDYNKPVKLITLQVFSELNNDDVMTTIVNNIRYDGYVKTSSGTTLTFNPDYQNRLAGTSDKYWNGRALLSEIKINPNIIENKPSGKSTDLDEVIYLNIVGNGKFEIFNGDKIAHYNGKFDSVKIEIPLVFKSKNTSFGNVENVSVYTQIDTSNNVNSNQVTKPITVTSSKQTPLCDSNINESQCNMLAEKLLNSFNFIRYITTLFGRWW